MKGCMVIGFGRAEGPAGTCAGALAMVAARPPWTQEEEASAAPGEGDSAAVERAAAAGE